MAIIADLLDWATLTSFRLLLMLSVTIIGVAIVKSVPTRPVATVPTSAVVHSKAPIAEPASDRLTNTVWLSAGSTLIVGSLDQNAQHHLVKTQWVPATETHLVAKHAPIESTELFDVRRVTSRRVKTGRSFELEEYTDRSLPPLECFSEANHRRFAVPYFLSHGGAFERMVIGNVIAAGTCTRIYLADDQADEATVRPIAQEIVHQLEVGLREFVEDQLTPIADVDLDKHLTIVMCSLAEKRAVGPGEVPIRGCVREKDFLDRNWGFGGDIIYVDLELPSGKQLAAVLAHELAHAATFSAQRRWVANATNSQRLPFWLNEGIAHLLEFSVCAKSDNLRSRLAKYQATPSAYPLVLPDDFPSRMVRRGPARAAALSFLRFLVAERPGLLLNTIEAGSDGIGALELGTGMSFDELFREWAVNSVADRQSIKVGSSDPAEFTIAGTSFVTIRPNQKAGYLTVEAGDNAKLQLTVVQSNADSPRSERLGSRPRSRF